MAKFVIAGRVDCPRYAKAEMLSETLSAQLPHFNINKVIEIECSIYRSTFIWIYFCHRSLSVKMSGHLGCKIPAQLMAGLILLLRLR